MVYKKTNRRMSEMVGEENENENEIQDFAYGNANAEGGKNNLGRMVAIVLIVLIVIIGGWYLLDKYTSLNLPKLPGMSQSSSDDWQAVFLTNGQVYFGKIKDIGKDNMILENIYYLQVVTKPLQTTAQSAAAAANQQQELTLIKLGNELHGPVDEMSINRDQILLTEKLKTDSRVVQAIDSYVAEQAKK